MAVELRASIGKLTGDAQQDVKVMYNYVMQLTEELRYAMNNIGISNLNDRELARYENGRLQIYAETVEVKTKELRVELGGELDELHGLISATTEEILAELEDTDRELRAQIKLTGDSISQIVSSVGSNGEVTAASIALAINNAGSEVLIDADRIRMTGDVWFVTAEDLTDGQTVISGSNIQTGAITAVDFYARGQMDGSIDTSFIVQKEMSYRGGSFVFDIGGISYQYDTESYLEFADKLWIKTEPGDHIDPVTGYVYTAYPGVKIESAGGVSISSQFSADEYGDYIPGLVYIKSDGQITFDGGTVSIFDGSGVVWRFQDGHMYRNNTIVI